MVHILEMSQNALHLLRSGLVKVWVVEQEVGSELFVLVTQHVCPQNGLSVKAQRLQLKGRKMISLEKKQSSSWNALTLRTASASCSVN